MRVPKTILNECTVDGAAITTIAKGFINGNIFLKWIDHFTSSVPSYVPRPMLLICDECSPHVRLDTVERCERSQVLLVCLQPNATHLVQPLDVTVFHPFKRGITSENEKNAARSSVTTLSKESEVQVASKFFVEHVTGKQSNTKNVFVATGLFPPSIDMMVCQLGKFTGSTKHGDGLGLDAWLLIREKLRTEVFLLPPKRQKTLRHRSLST
uniref:PREDICTED: similar to AGAP001049PA putative n=1 Tax=Albugo laibachii Nc14 TaxID=890382 RepID=F0W3W6_9STRA|nr:PREDICTED: similar to AGAP001049PA putative [Albugo laibachii Nc14]|eukprot:CCA15761.1 PREDICTED: similar to AGAP001049PA putative [Albugo laibachii Nc14]